MAMAAVARAAVKPPPAASPRRHSPRAYEAQLLARGGQPRWPTCAYPPSPDDDARTEENRAGVPVGAYVCDRADAVQKVRAALKGTGRLKRDGVTRFDARVWDACRGDDAHGGANRGSEEPHPPSAASWAVHAFAPLDPGSELPELLALAASGEATFVRNVRLGHPACYVDWDPDDGAAERGDDADRPLGTRTPTITTDEARRVIRERRDEEAFARARRGRRGGVRPPRWKPEAHDALASVVVGAEGAAAGSGAGAGAGHGHGGVPVPEFPPFTFSELFAGVGGFGIALRSLGGSVVFASEMCPHARRTYAANNVVEIGDAPPALIVGDITDVCEDIIPPHDILTGGFPCQSFSQRGERKGFEDARGQLFREIARVLGARKPTAFFLENVEGLVTLDDGAAFQIILKELEDVGYDVHSRVYDAKGWVPQSRKRVYLVGFRKDAALATPFRWPPRRDDCGGTVDDILEEEVEEESPEDGYDADVEDDDANVFTSCEVSEYQMDRASAYFKRVHHREPDHPGFLFAETGGVARTLCASYRKSSAYNAELVRADATSTRRARPRYYTPREAARVMGFPETFQPDPERAYHELGNAVVPPLVRTIAEAILRSMGESR